MSGHWAGSTRRDRLPPDWPRRRTRILRRDHHRCQHCGAPATDVDHIVPGDDHHDTNLQALCRPCHNTKTQAEAQAARHHPDRPTRDRPTRPHPGLATTLGGDPPTA